MYFSRHTISEIFDPSSYHRYKIVDTLIRIQHYITHIHPRVVLYPCRNCPTYFQVPIRARSDFPHVAAGGHMMWPGLEPHRIMIDKIIFKFCVVVELWRVRKHRIVGEISYILIIYQHEEKWRSEEYG